MEPLSSTLPNGLTLVQRAPDCAVDLRRDSKTYGWLFTRSADTNDQWVTVRKIEDWEVMQAEDQRDGNIVQHGTNVRGG